MITRELLTLPGDYTFPITLITEYRCKSEVIDCAISKEMAEILLRDYGNRMVQADMVAGRILSVDFDLSEKQGQYSAAAVFSCREMIAREQTVDLFGSEQIYDGTDSERGSG